VAAVKALVLSSCTVTWIAWDAEQNGSGTDTVLVGLVLGEGYKLGEVLSWLGSQRMVLSYSCTEN